MLFSNDDKWFLYHFFKGRGRQESEGTDDVEDYRARQPSEPALWDFLSTKFPTVKGLDFHMYYLLIINCYLMLTQLMSVKIVKKGPDFLWNSQNHETAGILNNLYNHLFHNVVTSDVDCTSLSKVNTLWNKPFYFSFEVVFTRMNNRKLFNNINLECMYIWLSSLGVKFPKCPLYCSLMQENLFAIFTVLQYSDICNLIYLCKGSFNCIMYTLKLVPKPATVYVSS